MRSTGGFFTHLRTEDTAEARDFLRRRLRLFAKLIVFLSGGFFLAGLVVTLIVAPQLIGEVFAHPATHAHLAATGAQITVWALLLRDRSATALDAIDMLGMLVTCVAFSRMTAGQQGDINGELVVLLATSWTLVARAALVPSHPIRTAIVGLVGIAPLVLATYWTVLANGRPVNEAFYRALYVVFWGAVAGVTTTVVSWIIYGLHRQVREAQRVGQYTLVEKIGEGGMGVVFRATHALLRRPTAIKLLQPERAGAASLVRFEREVQMTSQLTHPNTVAIYDYGRTPDGTFYYAMEYLDGLTLEDLVAGDGPQPPARVVHITRQVCGALQEAHVAGLVHRDVKPANILLATRGGIPDVVKVLDFGLVKARAGEPDLAISSPAALIGTPHYLAPEAITSPDDVDARTDIYALGACIYYLLTGTPVFSGRTLVEICSKHLLEAPESPSDRAGHAFPSGLDDVVLACLEKRADRRPQSAAALVEALDSAAVDAWSAIDAAAWWTDSGARLVEEVRARRSSPDSGGSTAQLSVALDVSSRGDHASVSGARSR